MRHHLIYLLLYGLMLAQNNLSTLVLCSSIMIIYELKNWLLSKTSNALQSYFVLFVIRLEWSSYGLTIPIELIVPMIVLVGALVGSKKSIYFFVSKRNIGLILLIFLTWYSFKLIAHFRFRSEIESWINLFVIGIFLFHSLFCDLNSWNNKLFSLLKLVGLLISTRVLLAFFLGESLLFNSDVTLDSATRYNFIFKATYYFSSFFYILGCSWLIFMKDLLTTKIYISEFASFLVISIAILLNFNLSLIFTLLLLSAIVVFYYSDLKTMLKLSVVSFILMSISFLGASKLSYSSLMIDRLTLKETSSFDARISVFTSALKTFYKTPLDLVMGIGSESLTRNEESSHIRDYKWNALFGQYEGTVDSNWLTFLFENGFILSLLLVGCISYYFYKYGIWNNIGLLILMFLITGSTQIFLYSKVALLFYVPLITNIVRKNAHSSRLY